MTRRKVRSAGPLLMNGPSWGPTGAEPVGTATACYRLPPLSRPTHLLAGVLYLAIAIFWYRAILPDPTGNLPYPAAVHELPSFTDLATLDHADQSMVLATVIQNATSFVAQPFGPLAEGQCYPTERSHTLGEHMFGVGLVAAPIHALTGDPILTYNLMLIVRLWIAAMAMYALTFHFTGNGAAAIVAGAILGLAPVRVVDPAHPYVHGDLWMPLVLLFLHRVFARGGVANALGLTVFSCLLLTESLYSVLAAAILCGLVAVALAVQYRDRLARVGLLLVVPAGLVLVTTYVVFAPYLATRATWEVLGGRESVAASVAEVGFGQLYFPGVVVLALVGLGLGDRLRGARRTLGWDPRIVFFTGALLLIWSALGPVPIPGTGILLSSPLAVAKDVVPGLDAVRGLEAVVNGMTVPLALLGGYGSLVLLRAVGAEEGVRSLAVAGLLVLAVLAVRTYDPIARASFGRPLRLHAWLAVPRAEEIELLRASPAGARLDLPLAFVDGRPTRLRVSSHLLFGSYRPGPSAVCYNSFITPVQPQVAALGSQLPSAPAARALSALGFESVFAHLLRFDDEDRAALLAGVNASEGRAVLEPIGETERMAAFRLVDSGPSRGDWALLRAPAFAPREAPFGSTTPVRSVPFTFHNEGDAVFRHPAPLAPSDVTLRVYDTRGHQVEVVDERVLLPLALAPGGTLTLDVPTSLPLAPGRYEVELVRAERAGDVLARRGLLVR